MLIRLQRRQYFVKILQPVTYFATHNNTKLNMGSKTAYFHMLEDDEKFKVSFCYINDAVGVNRQFNFQRNALEPVQSFLSRVSANLEKVVTRKTKKKRKNSDNDEEEEVKVSVELLSGNESVAETDICKEVFFSSDVSSGSLILRMLGLDYVVSINSPWVDSITLPSSMMVGFPVYANTFETKFTDRTLSLFKWKKQSPISVTDSTSKSDKKENKALKQNVTWEDVGEGYLYIPKMTDIGCKLKLECTPKNSTTAGPLIECESSAVVEAGPGHCPFEDRNLYTNVKSSKGSFRTVSYNILADIYSSTETAQNELFSYCPGYALNIDYRKQLFLKEILGYNADILCLQEVDRKVFHADLTPVLADQGLVGVHAKKATVSEGVAIFYSSSKFKLLDVKEVVLSEELLNKNYCSHILTAVEKNSQLKERISGLGTAALALILESTETPGEILVVGNTHLYFHPDADHIRLLQGGVLIAFLTSLINECKIKNPDKQVSLVCCGDFNSVPECGIYKLMTTNSVPSDFIDWKSKPEEEVKDLSLSQPFTMQSACGTPKYTNFTVGFADCLDYIYYQSDSLQVESVVPLPSEDELREHSAIPSVVFPSDHVALVADLSWRRQH